jgi:hypothetical protein
MDRQLEWIQRQIVSFGERGRTFRYPEAFQDRVVAWAHAQRERGTTQAEISRQVDVPWETIRRWIDRRADQGSQPETTGLVPVQIAGVAQAQAGNRLVLVSPDGWRIEGLGPDQVVEVFGRLR